MGRAQVGLQKPTRGKIAALAKQIGQRFHAERIILFGSCARGKPTPDSDVDLLVVMRTRRRPAEQATAIRRAVDFPFPVDLLVRTPRQVKDRLAMGDCFIREIVTQGKVLYEAARQ
jgi:predicted nucleotidyltransferase